MNKKTEQGVLSSFNTLKQNIKWSNITTYFELND